MALVTGPLLSLGATGKFARSLLYQGSIRGPIARRLGGPRPDPTLDQIVQQRIVAGSIIGWHAVHGNALFDAQWHALRKRMPKQWTDYSFWEMSVIKLAARTAGTGFCMSFEAAPSGAVKLTAIDSATGLAPSDTVMTQLWRGTSPDTMAITQQFRLSNSIITLPSELLPGQALYYKMTRLGIPASGLALITYQPPPPNLILNGSFQDTDHWTLEDYYTVSGNALHWSPPGYSHKKCWQSVPALVDGRSYHVTVRLLTRIDWISSRITIGATPSGEMYPPGDYAWDVTAGSTGIVAVDSTGDGSSASWTDLSVIANS